MASGAQIVKNTMSGKNYESIVEKATERAMAAVGEHLSGIAELDAPVKSGRLAASITWATSRDGNSPRPDALPSDKVSSPRKKNVVYIGTNVEYAQHIEYGTKNRRFLGIGYGGTRMAAQSFLRRALNDERSRVRKMYQEELHKGLKSGR